MISELGSKYHRPVMAAECLEALDIKPEGIYVDVTFGGGGHSKLILEKLNEKGKLFGFDKDPDAFEESKKITHSNFTLIRSDFRNLKQFLQFYGVDKVDGILADLGVSSHQFDEGSRGFSTRFDGPLDMRMNPNAGFSAAEWLADVEHGELTRVLRMYGEVPNPQKVANAILKERAASPIETTAALKEAVAPFAPKFKDFKFFAQIFQALRIVVNDELKSLEEFLEQSAEVLGLGGRLVVMSYHSLEDRLVKEYLRSGNFDGRIYQDLKGNVLKPFDSVFRKPIEAGEEELAENPRARSAKLRAGERNRLPIKPNGLFLPTA